MMKHSNYAASVVNKPDDPIVVESNEWKGPKRANAFRMLTRQNSHHTFRSFRRTRLRSDDGLLEKDDEKEGSKGCAMLTPGDAGLRRRLSDTTSAKSGFTTISLLGACSSSSLFLGPATTAMSRSRSPPGDSAKKQAINDLSAATSLTKVSPSASNLNLNRDNLSPLNSLIKTTRSLSTASCASLKEDDTSSMPISSDTTNPNAASNDTSTASTASLKHSNSVDSTTETEAAEGESSLRVATILRRWNSTRERRRSFNDRSRDSSSPAYRRKLSWWVVL